jgi:hypothetical protein
MLYGMKPTSEEAGGSAFNPQLAVVNEKKYDRRHPAGRRNFYSVKVES